MTTIREVVFDLGAVLVDWNPRYLYATLIPDHQQREWFLAEVCHSAWNLAQDAGRSWPDAEAEAIARHPDQAALIRAYRQRWIEMIAGPITGTVAILDALATTGIGLTALSNWAADTFAEAAPGMPFLKHFRGITVSGRIGMIKPDPAIFHHHARAFSLTPAETLFIDDNPDNIRSATNLGYRCHQFTAPDQLKHHLKELALLPRNA
jgi:HAD superfamily hydrolase (TIGR01509 family)